MVSVNIEFPGSPNAATHAVELYPRGNDTVAASGTATEQTNRKGVYRVTLDVDESLLPGSFDLLVKTAGVVRAAWVVRLAATEDVQFAGAFGPLEYDVRIDTSNASQWQMVYTIRGTDDVILRRNLYDQNGNPITSAATVIAREIEEPA